MIVWLFVASGGIPECESNERSYREIDSLEICAIPELVLPSYFIFLSCG